MGIAVDMRIAGGCIRVGPRIGQSGGEASVDTFLGFRPFLQSSSLNEQPDRIQETPGASASWELADTTGAKRNDAGLGNHSFSCATRPKGRSGEGRC